MQPSKLNTKNFKPSNSRAVCLLQTWLIAEQLASDMTSAQEQVDEASAAVDAIVSEIQSIEKDHSKQKVIPIMSYLTDRISTPISPPKWTVREPVSQTLMKNFNPSTPSSVPKT